MSLSFRKKIIIAALAGVFVLAGINEAQALPAWARKYNADCQMCHTMLPRLNPVGHKFRRLGFKMPEEFDSGESEFSWNTLSQVSNYIAARARARVVGDKTKGAATDIDFQEHDVTLFYAGSVSRNIGFFFELPFEPEEGMAFLEVGSIHLNFGDSDSFFFTRAGQFHQFSRVGYGALDRPIGLNNPRVFDTRVNGFRPRHDGAGVEAGYSYKNFTALLQATNGITAAGASVLDNEDPNNDKDFAALFEYMIPDRDGSVSALYVYGRAPTPETNTAGTAVTGAVPTRYHRIYAFGDYTFDAIGLKPIIGGGIGFDNQFITGIGTATAALVSASSSRSWFTFLELDQRITDSLYAIGRFDYDDATNQAEAAAATRKTWMGTGGFAWSWQRFLKLAAEYQATDNAAQNIAHRVTGEMQLNF